MRDSGGKGVDIVLNSLAGDFIPRESGYARAGWSVRGNRQDRHLERNKGCGRVPGAFSYSAFISASCRYASAGLVRQMLLDLLADFEKGVLQPLPLGRTHTGESGSGLPIHGAGICTPARS